MQRVKGIVKKRASDQKLKSPYYELFIIHYKNEIEVKVAFSCLFVVGLTVFHVNSSMKRSVHVFLWNVLKDVVRRFPGRR